MGLASLAIAERFAFATGALQRLHAARNGAADAGQLRDGAPYGLRERVARGEVDDVVLTEVDERDAQRARVRPAQCAGHRADLAQQHERP